MIPNLCITAYPGTIVGPKEIRANACCSAHYLFYEWYGMHPAQCTYFPPAQEANVRGEGKTVHVVY
jgi:hypothetical protein